MTIEEIRRRLAQLETLRSQAQTVVSNILEASLGAARAQTEDEAAQIAEARGNVTRIDAEVDDLRAEMARLEEAEANAAGNHQQANGEGGEGGNGEGGEGGEGDPAGRRAAAAGVTQQRLRVGREPRTYERHDLRTSYLRDMLAVTFQRGSIDPVEARSRLDRHAGEVRVDLPGIEARIARARGGFRDEIRIEGEDGAAEVRYNAEPEQRDLNRTDGTGGEFVPPLWLLEDWIGVSRGARVFADQCFGMPLPGGTDSISIPRVATGTETAAQDGDNTAVTETDATTDSVTAPVRTIAGQQDVAMQLLDQSPIAFDQIVFQDLGEDHAEQTDIYCINGTGANGQFLGVLNIPGIDTTTYTDADPTVPELYPKLADSANEVATNRKRPVTAVFMAPRRWYWMLSQTDASNRPLVVMNAQGPQNALMAANDGNPFAEGGPVGVSPFGTVFIDPNMPVNLGGGTEDRVILTRPRELYLWEGAVRTRILQEVLSGTLTIRLQLFNYAAFMPNRRPENTSVVAGTGLVTPTF